MAPSFFPAAPPKRNLARLEKRRALRSESSRPNRPGMGVVVVVAPVVVVLLWKLGPPPPPGSGGLCDRFAVRLVGWYISRWGAGM